MAQEALAEIQGKEQELQARKAEIVQLKLELQVARDEAARLCEEFRLAKEEHLKEIETAKAAHSAEQLRRASAEHEAKLEGVKVQFRQQISSLELSQDRYVEGLKDMMTSLLPAEERALAPELTGEPAPKGPAAPGSRGC